MRSSRGAESNALKRVVSKSIEARLSATKRIGKILMTLFSRQRPREKRRMISGKGHAIPSEDEPEWRMLCEGWDSIRSRNIFSRLFCRA